MAIENIQKRRKTAMSDALQTIVHGIQRSVSRATQAVNDIVNASSTGQNIDKDMVDVKIASHEVAMQTAVIKADKKMKDALLDIEV